MPLEAPCPAHALQIIYADDSILVLNKPAGLLSVPGRGPDKQDCLSTRVQMQFPDALVVHRLDMATSGLIIMARGVAAQRVLSLAFENRAVHKRYEAVVQGLVQAPVDSWQTIDLPIAADWPRRPLRIIDKEMGQPSLTRYRVISTSIDEQSSRLALAPITGRTHQLRVHLLAIGHPICGDALYAPDTVCAAAPRLMLHACELTLNHPQDGRTLQFACAAQF
jgi:tRNA pseudouridine32 synthase/23S rRNA pseudouridine746 synthase